MKYIALIFMIIITLNVHCEEVKQDSIPDTNFKLAAYEVIGLNLGVWSVDHYIAKAEWANISIESVKKQYGNRLFI